MSSDCVHVKKPWPLMPPGVPKHHILHMSKIPDGKCHSECPEDCAATAVSMPVVGDIVSVESSADETTDGCP